MKRYALLALSAIMLSVPNIVFAEENTPSDADITALGRHLSRNGWLTTSGPDERNLYTAAIYIGDLNPATSAGWAKMASRVAQGTAELCDRAQAQPHVAGYYNAEQRACWAETRAPAALQMERAREAATRGEPRIAMIGVGLR